MMKIQCAISLQLWLLFYRGTMWGCDMEVSNGGDPISPLVLPLMDVDIAALVNSLPTPSGPPYQILQDLTNITPFVQLFSFTLEQELRVDKIPDVEAKLEELFSLLPGMLSTGNHYIYTCTGIAI